MYVDESGDCGLQLHNSPTRYFVLTGVVLHERMWKNTLDRLINFRRRLRASFGLRLREELHAAAMINHPGDLVRIRRNDRLTIIRKFADEIAGCTDLNVINVVVDKQDKPEGYPVFERAWEVLIQRFENTILHRNFPASTTAEDVGMLFPDHTDDKKLTRLLRRMRRYNPVPHERSFTPGYRNLKLNLIVEDPNFRVSDHSFFIQAADLAAFLLYQHLQPNAYMRRKSAQNYFRRLRPVLCTHASTKDPEGIVRL